MTRLSKAPASYGVSYQGSKNKIAAEVVYNIPSAPLLIDVFAGGGAITHAALLSHRFSSILANDYDCGALQLFYRASHGLIDFEEERKRWVSREDFKRLKDTDPIVRYHWSFSNNGRNYSYSKEIEPYKRAYHFARNCNDRTEWNAIGLEKFEPTRLSIRDHAEEIKDIYIRWWLKHNCYEGEIDVLKLRKNLGSLENFQSLQKLQSLGSLQRRQSLERLEKLQSLERLERLQSLQRLERLTISKADYKDIFVSEPTTVIYCDPPYINTSGYEDAIRESGFNHAEFYDWCEAQKGLVVLSEYTAPADRFTCVWSKEKKVLAGGAKHQITKVERLFVVKGHEDDYWDLMEAHKPSTLFDLDQRQAMI